MSIVANLKVNRIGGNYHEWWNMWFNANYHEWWNMWFNAIIHVEPYQFFKKFTYIIVLK